MTHTLLFGLVLLLSGGTLVASDLESEEECRIRIDNRFDGAIAASTDRGASWRPIGRVLRPNLGFVQETDDKGFTASDWAPDSAIAASAVNALHIRIAKGTAHSVLFSIQPRDLFQKSADDVKSYYSNATSIYTDIPAGTSLFGADWAPRVGDKVRLQQGPELAQLPADYRPAMRDRLVFLVARPRKRIEEIHFENREGGRVLVTLAGERPRTVAKVLRAVRATGRFGGTQFAGRGFVRANHPGVLCISSAPKGQIGGFQIVPSAHAREPNLAYVWGAIAAWLVIGPAESGSPPLEGQPPLFAGHLRPGTGHCEVRFEAGGWVPLPERIGRLEDALAGVTDIRLRF